MDIYKAAYLNTVRKGTCHEILVSIRPRYVDMILNRTKTLEYRRTMPKDYFNVTRMWIYETAPVKMVVACAGVSVWSGSVFDENRGGISRDEYDAYFMGAKYAFGIHIVELDVFKRPLKLDSFGISRPPQSWMYVAKGE